jgi:hypothetical protein
MYETLHKETKKEETTPSDSKMDSTRKMKESFSGLPGVEYVVEQSSADKCFS